MKTQREEEEDRLSHLPQPLLHHILSELTYHDPKEAVRTCVLSKSWCYLVSNNPNVTFHEDWFAGENKKEACLSFVVTTLQSYQDQKFSFDNFALTISSEVDSEWKRLLEKWVPILMLNMGVKTFNLYIKSETSACFDLPSEVFRAELPLQNLYLQRCMLSQINSVSIVDNLVFKHLQTLSLSEVYIADKTFEKIMSCCPLIEEVSLEECVGLKTIKVTTDNKLIKRFEYMESHKKEENDDCKIKIDVLTIEEIRTWDCPNWFHHHCHKNFVHLKDLYLWKMRLSKKSFGTFSHNFPCLEDLTLNYCYGFKEIKLSSSSIERLTITRPEKSTTKVTIHAPNILYFNYKSKFLPSSFSFTTTASGRHGWKSDICLDIGSLCFFRLNEMLKALRQSEISLDLDVFFCKEDADNKLGLIESVGVENLVLSGYFRAASSVRSFLNFLFRVCRPRNIFTKLTWRFEQREDEKLNKLLCKFLQKKRKRRRYYFRQQDLEEVRMELCEDGREELAKTVFRLKWKEKS